jgi:hypothetical protein
MIRRSIVGISLVRRRTRRWLVLSYWTIILLLVGVLTQTIGKESTVFGMPLFWFFWPVGILTGLLGGTRPNGAIRAFQGRSAEERSPIDYSFMTPYDIAEQKQRDNELRLDERDVNLRNAVHYQAYSAVRWIALIAFFASGPPLAHEPVALRRFLLLLFFLVIWSLPQTLILWTEPDMEEEQAQG